MTQDPWTPANRDRGQEPEILPPDAEDPWRRRDNSSAAFRLDGFQGVYIRRVGPLGIFIGLAILMIVLAALVLLFAGALLIWIPLIAIVLAGSILASVYRRFRGPR